MPECSAGIELGFGFGLTSDAVAIALGVARLIHLLYIHASRNRIADTPTHTYQYLRKKVKSAITLCFQSRKNCFIEDVFFSMNMAVTTSPPANAKGDVSLHCQLLDGQRKQPKASKRF